MRVATLLKIVAGLVFVVVAATFVALLVIDPNEYKDEIVAAVESRTGRAFDVAIAVDSIVGPRHADVDRILSQVLRSLKEGGILLAIADQLKVPVRFIGIGESLDDMQPFDAGEFADALLASGTAQ